MTDALAKLDIQDDPDMSQQKKHMNVRSTPTVLLAVFDK